MILIKRTKNTNFEHPQNELFTDKATKKPMKIE